MTASFCVSSGNVWLCARTFKAKTIGREAGRDGSSMQHHLFPLNLDEWRWILPPTPPVLKALMFCHSKQVFILEGASKMMKRNSFIVQIGKACLWEVFIKVTKVPDHGDWQDLSTEIMPIIHTHFSSFSMAVIQWNTVPMQLRFYHTWPFWERNQRNWGIMDSGLAAMESVWPPGPLGSVLQSPLVSPWEGGRAPGRIHTSKVISSHNPRKALVLE